MVFSVEGMTSQHVPAVLTSAVDPGRVKNMNKQEIDGTKSVGIYIQEYLSCY